MNPISIWCERQTASFTKGFKKRYVTFDQESRRLSYAEDDRKPQKDVIIITKVVRSCEVMEVRAHELFTLIIDGKHEDGKEDQWSLRMPNREVFEEWTRILWDACASAGLMETFNSGLPLVDPRTKLPFAQVPLEHLFKFSVLDKAVLYFFDSVTLVTSTTGKDHHSKRHRLVVGDKAIYIFTQNAVAVCCSPISHIRKIYHSPDATFFAIHVKPPAPDIVVNELAGCVQLASILSRLFEVITGKSLVVMPINVPTAEVLIESQQLRLSPNEGYKLHVVSPTNKTRLRQTLDADSTGMVANTEEKVNLGERGQPQVGGESSAAAFKAPEANDPLTTLFRKIGMEEYAPMLLNQHVDLDVLQCMDTSDLMTFGIKNEAHRKKILDAALSMDTTSFDALDDDVFSPNFATRAAPYVTAAGGVALSDDDDLDIDVPVQPRGAVALDDDSDEDLLIGMSSANAAKPAIVFDDDDDL